ncbi:MAG: hypothetical protein WD824_21175 [Cyclobacteriaceae bacterium]
MEVTLNKTLISVLELRRLMVDLSEKRPDICIRFRLLGELWNNHFMRVKRISDKGAVLFDEANNLVSVSDLNFVMQFEIDKPFQGFQPYYHYEVTPVFDV